MSGGSGPLKLGVLVSGRGTNLQAIIDAVAGGELEAEIALVVCNHEGAGAIARAEAAGVEVALLEMGSYQSRTAHQQAIVNRLKEAQVELVVCAGWDRVLTKEFVRKFEGRIINVHPSLLPAFGGGLHAVEEALAYGVKITGCTVHFVTEEVDAGPIISQAAVQVEESDTPDSLAERIHREEHRLLVESIKLFAEGRLRISGRRVAISS